MRLDDLIAGAGEARVTGFAIDHRKVAPGTVFGAFGGTRFNGEDFIGDAVAAGAIAVIARPEATVAGAVHVADAEPRRAFARLAARFFAPFPTTTVAVTGPTARHRPSRCCASCGGWRGMRPPRSGRLASPPATIGSPPG
jgi:UDP-N-acetylmuramoyl-L-alanyl-D-glutamate--2,6-diaminopimelate ligase